MEFCNDGLFIFPQPRESVPILSKSTSLLSIIEHPRPDPTEHLPSSFYYSAGHFFPTVLPRPQCGVAATPFPSYSPYRESQHLSLLPHWAQRPPSQSCALPWLHLPTGLNTGIVAVLPLSGWCPLTTNISNFDEVQFFFFLLTLLVSYLRNCYINLWSQKFICMFPVRSFIVKAPIFRSFISWVNSCKRCIEGGSNSFFFMWTSSCAASFVKKTILSPLNGLGIFWKTTDHGHTGLFLGSQFYSMFILKPVITLPWVF